MKSNNTYPAVQVEIPKSEGVVLEMAVISVQIYGPVRIHKLANESLYQVFCQAFYWQTY